MEKENLEIGNHGDNLLEKVSKFIKENKSKNVESEISFERTQEIIDLLNEEVDFLTRVLNKRNQQNK
jgi:hypothetical protein